MPDPTDLAGRIAAQFSALEDKYKKFQAEQTQQYQERQQRLQQLGQVFDQLSAIWRPRLEVLRDKFSDQVKVTPKVSPSTREATFEFQSNLARVTLRFSATTDRDVSKIILTSDLIIVPVLMHYDAHSELAFPINNIDTEAVARWIDDRIVSFVETYLALHENEYYLRDQVVTDPVAGVRFPKYAAGATLEHGGQTYYFVSVETRREFEKQRGIVSK
jgi:YHS domain-containing protein